MDWKKSRMNKTRMKCVTCGKEKLGLEETKTNKERQKGMLGSATIDFQLNILRTRVQKSVLLALLQTNVAATYLCNRNRDAVNGETAGLFSLNYS